MPGLLSGYRQGRQAAQTADIEQQKINELKSQNAWDREFKSFKNATDWAGKLPVSQRGNFMKNYLTKHTGDSKEFQGLAELLATSDDNTFKETIKIYKEIDRKRQAGESPSFEIMQLETLLGKDDPHIDFLKNRFKLDVKEMHNKDVDAAYDLLRSDNKVDDDELEDWRKIMKRNPKAVLEATKLFDAENKAKDKDKDKLTSTVGKQIQDRQILISQYGEDSQQVKDFDKAITVKETGLTAEQKNVGAIQKSHKEETGEDLSYEEAFQTWNSMKGKSKEQWLLEIYSGQIQEAATDEESREAVSKARAMWDEVYGKETSSPIIGKGGTTAFGM